ncbi:hypothetical protein RHGRI_012214 [Rhododendron griersonianum]|uniref:Anoctamin transmembrane domain-containing protein n=1 Tax=Rhododendron griersonianum TaxID=479676 RepID=A0AAV6KR20_9ERIC|nr:hypothetical protein RHGRI_012214 [Rhododendron griersonianum]
MTQIGALSAISPMESANYRKVMHDLRLIHNDLKPENILLISSEYIKVPDYKVNKSDSTLTLKSDCKEFQWESGESLLEMLELRGFVKQVFPLHDETKKKQLLRTWAFNCWDFTRQPIDEIYAYFGTKIATYFAFLGMFTRWILFPAIFGVTLHFVDLGSMQLFVLPAFFISITLWAVLFFQSWKRKNSALLARWQISGPVAGGPGYKFSGLEWSSIQSPVEFMKKWGSYKTKENELPFELAYAHLYEVIRSDLMK